MSDSGNELSDLECDVDGCENEVLGLKDGWEFSRGLVCSDCIDYNRDHRHWPDEGQKCHQCRREAEV